MGEPVTKVRSLGRPHSWRYRRACSEYARFTSEMMSTIRRFVSSGRHSSLQRFPASMWKMGTCSRLAAMAERHEFVSPRISSASGRSSAISLYEPLMMFPIVSPRSLPTASR